MDPRGRVVLVVRVNHRGHAHEFAVREEDNPLQLARRFCKVRSLPESVCDSLARTIDQSIEDLVQQELFLSKHQGNLGAELYYKGTQMQKRHMREIEEQRELKRLHSQSELTFKPQLNKKSVKLAARRSVASLNGLRASSRRLHDEASERKLKQAQLASQA